MKPYFKQWKKKSKSKKTDMLKSIDKQSGESAEKKTKTTVKRICRKKGFKPGVEK